MIGTPLLRDILFPKKTPNTRNLRQSPTDSIFPEGLTMGTLLIGKQGSGKTSFLAKHLVEKFKNRPLEAVFVLDWSGSITDRILSLILQEETSIRSELLKRVIYDELGNPEWVKSMP